MYTRRRWEYQDDYVKADKDLDGDDESCLKENSMNYVAHDIKDDEQYVDYPYVNNENVEFENPLTDDVINDNIICYLSFTVERLVKGHEVPG